MREEESLRERNKRGGRERERERSKIENIQKIYNFVSIIRIVLFIIAKFFNI